MIGLTLEERAGVYASTTLERMVVGRPVGAYATRLFVTMLAAAFVAGYVAAERDAPGDSGAGPGS